MDGTTDPALEPVCIIGAGIAGLTAAHDLVRQGRQVLVLEGAAEVGGLASSLAIDGQPIDRFHHFICRGDHDLVELISELGISHRLHWRQCTTSFLFDGRLFDFGTPIDLLRFGPVPLTQRIRFGLNIVRSRYRKSWRQLDPLSAKAWLTRQIGARAYEVIWEPLLKIKFGEAHERVSAAWIWHRIHRVASSRRKLWEREHLGYLELGSATVIDALLDRLHTLGGFSARTGARVEDVCIEEGKVCGVRLVGQVEPIRCQQVISTIALPLLARLCPALDAHYRRRLQSIDYLAVVCGLLKLTRPLTSSFWVNINDPRTPYNGIIEYSNLNRHLDLGGSAIVYVPLYLEAGHPRYGFDDQTLLAELVDCLRCVNPAFERSWIEEHHISRASHAQAVCAVGFADSVPDHRAPARGLYLTDSTQFYPEDRTISAAIRLGRRVARMVLDDAPICSRGGSP